MTERKYRSVRAGVFQSTSSRRAWCAVSTACDCARARLATGEPRNEDAQGIGGPFVLTGCGVIVVATANALPTTMRSSSVTVDSSVRAPGAAGPTGWYRTWRMRAPRSA